MSGDPNEKALGSDPFQRSDGTLPYLTRLRERTLRTVSEHVLGEPSEAPPPPKRPSAPDLGPPSPERSGIEVHEEGHGLSDRAATLLLGSEDAQRIQRAFASVAECGRDPFGLDLKTARRALAVFKQLYRYYFRVDSQGHSAVPEKGPALLAGNHGGLLPFDGAMVIVDLLLRGEPPRLVRSIVDRWAGSLPFVNVFYARVGQVIGTRPNVRALLERDQLVLVFPEGVAGIRKRAAERYVLQDFHVGFVEESLRYRVPIVPVAVVGADDQSPILYDLKPLAKLLGLPVFPITPTFPLLGPRGLLPYPVRYEIRYGEPFRFYDEYPAEAARDPHAIRYMAERVRDRIQEMVDEGVLARRGRDRE